MDLIKLHDNLKEIKDEINKFTDMLLQQKSLPNINELKAITKLIILMKTITNYSGESHYNNCLVYDILATMHSLTNKSVRQFHYIYRSFIENYVRSMLNLKDDDETGVNKLFQLIHEKLGNTDVNQQLLDFISGEYGKSCLFVHSNSKSNASIQLYYQEFILTDDFKQRTLSSTINKILLILKMMTELLIYTYPHVVENAFYRRKQQLKFLLGEKLYNKLLESIEQ